MVQNEYSASAVKWPFWFLEFKKMVGLLNDGITYAQIRQKNVDDNIFSASSKERAVMIMNTVSARVEAGKVK